MHAAQCAGRNGLDTVGDEERRADQQQRRGQRDGVARARRGLAEEQLRDFEAARDHRDR